MSLEEITVGREARIMLGTDTFCFGRFQNQATREIVKNPDTMCGDIDHPVGRVLKGRKLVRGILYLDPTPATLAVLVPWLGITDLTGGVYALGAADVLVEKNVKIDMKGAQHNWSNCVVLQYAFRGSKGGRPMSLQLAIEGEDETEAVSAFVDNPLAIKEMFAFTSISTRQLDNAGGTLTSRPIDRFLVQVDNRVVSEWNSSITRTGAKVGDRQAIFATSVPYTTTHKDLYWIYRDTPGPVEAKLKLTNNHGTIEFFMPGCTPITKGPDVLSKPDQIRTPITFDMNRSDNAGTRVSPMTITLT